MTPEEDGIEVASAVVFNEIVHSKARRGQTWNKNKGGGNNVQFYTGFRSYGYQIMEFDASISGFFDIWTSNPDFDV